MSFILICLKIISSNLSSRALFTENPKLIASKNCKDLNSFSAEPSIVIILFSHSSFILKEDYISFLLDNIFLMFSE